jgi:hypothetical protein
VLTEEAKSSAAAVLQLARTELDDLRVKLPLVLLFNDTHQSTYTVTQPVVTEQCNNTAAENSIANSTK